MELASLPHVASHTIGPLHGGVQLTVKFDNGWGASVVQHQYSYGGRDGLYELAVLDSDDNLSYVTDITDDVIGSRTESEIRTLLLRIANLTRNGWEIDDDTETPELTV